MGFDFGAALGLHDEALKLRSFNAELIGNNLANADTPLFQARALDFKSLMEKVEAQAQPQTTISTTDDMHQGRSAPGTLAPDDVLYRVPLQAALDGNTVDAHVEKQQFMNNALRYNAELTFLNSKMSSLMSALRGE